MCDSPALYRMVKINKELIKNFEKQLYKDQHTLKQAIKPTQIN